MPQRRVRVRRIHPSRRSQDAGFHITWPMAVQIISLAGAVLAIYVGMSRQMAVLEERDANRRDQLIQMKTELSQGMQSLQSNFHGLETYILELHKQERGER
jgi:hypothetical protein